MSYQSKYTGEEIDELLDKVKAGGNMIEIGDCNLYSASANLPSSVTIELTQSILDFDFIIIEKQIWNSTSTYHELQPHIINVHHVLEGENVKQGYPCTSTDGYVNNNYETWCMSSLSFLSTSSLRIIALTRRGDGFVGVGLGKIYGIKLSGNNGDTTPTGNIISFMGTKAPQGYLICDGTEYNITDYPKLANHFAEQFENIAYFGGDGVNTFKVPDLRNEFLRGYGELSEEVGKHQDGTAVPISGMSALGSTSPLLCVMGPDDSPTWETYKTHGTRDCDEPATMSSTYYYVRTTKQGGDYQICNGRVRPTNIAVLYCIKY